MHLWPSGQIRESFKISYLRNLEWNLGRMKQEKKKKSSMDNQQQNQNQNQKLLLLDNESVGDVEVAGTRTKIGVLCRDLSILLSCCYCCFCCGACLDPEVT